MAEIDRRSFLGCAMSAAGAFALLSCAHRRAPSRIPRIGFINGSSFPSMTAAFHQELRRLGYQDGKNIRIETRLIPANSPSVADYLAELIKQDLDLVVAAALPVALAVRQIMPEMPMVIATAAGLVTNGFARSLERPGGNVTGMDELPPGLTAIRLKLLREAAPGISRIALLSTTPGQGGHELQLVDAVKAATELGVTVKPYKAASRAQLEAALAAMAEDKIDGLLNFQGALSLVNRAMIIDFAAEHRLPAIYQSRLFPESGGLMSYAPDQDEQFRVAARYVDQILRGAKPGDLPIRHPARYFLTVNTRVARVLGLALPASLLAKVDTIIS